MNNKVEFSLMAILIADTLVLAFVVLLGVSMDVFLVGVGISIYSAMFYEVIKVLIEEFSKPRTKIKVL